MAIDADANFFKRADAHIDLSNNQIEDVARDKVSASMMYGLARFNAWISACEFESGWQLAAARDQKIDFFMTQFRQMLEENFDDYADNFDRYMKRRE